MALTWNHSGAVSLSTNDRSGWHHPEKLASQKWFGRKEVVVPGTQRGFTTFGVGLALFLLIGGVFAACMSDDNDPGDSGDLDVQITASSGDEDDPTPMLATFTPVPPNFTPEAVQTRSYLQTAGALTATAQAQVTSTAPPASTFDPNIPTPTGSVAVNQIIPPGAGLATSGGIAPGSIGSYNWYDLRFNRGAEVTAPYVILPEGGADWASGTQARLEVGASPYAVTGAEIKLYIFDQNVAIPTDQSGNPGDTPAFYPQTGPVRQLTVQGADILFTPEVSPGRYIVEMRVDWSTPVGLNPLWTQYIFIVDVV
jgi:hypothetical protein